MEILRGLTRSARLTLCSLYLFAAIFIFFQWFRLQPQTNFLYSNYPSNLPNPFSNKIVFYEPHCVHYDVISPNKVEFERITQALHVSADILDERIIEQVSNWNAPVSLTVVLRNIHQYLCTVKFLTLIREKHPIIATYLRAHILLPASNDQDCSWVSETAPSFEGEERCLPYTPSIEERAVYPANVARNIARLFSTTRFVVITDYEHLFNEGFEEKVSKIASVQFTRNPKSLLVYRIFEIDDTVNEIPKDKLELHDMMQEGKAVVFHARYYKGAHEIPNLEEWLNKTTSDSLGIFARDVKYNRATWEPQFVSLSDIPLHDEAFPFQIRDNTVLRWELCRAGYTLDILDDVFMVHRGIKTRNIVNDTKKIQIYNRKKYKMTLTKKTVNGYEALKEILGTTSGRIFIFFSGSHVDGKSWCPDCVRAEPVVDKVTSEADVKNLTATFVTCYVGLRDYWKDQKCPFRTEDGFKVSCIPTVIEWAKNRRIIDAEVSDEKTLKEFLLNQ
ncbi:hypothetical protein WR25_18801 isoform A [Diploscapter pachys]|uniref:Thioredoxin domain-containing protein 17 n=2 Tax=Diploscapter pachys TaxID=2018661 RepID=A0A2A2J923_9BILA|nr:hypothetical protein WR25_18801 isoform A [Diploscapter pachys]